MNVFSETLFYLALIFGFGCGLIVSFQIGRLGLHQIFYWLVGTPAQKNPSGGEGSAICSLLGIPTSSGDLVAIAANLSPVKTAYDLAKYTYGNFGGSLVYLSLVFGKMLGRLWFMIGIPAFFLHVFVAQEYFPPWLVELGINEWEFCGVLLLGYVSSYLLGSAFASPQKQFNQARVTYERQVARHGYWFDNFLKRHFSYDKIELQRASVIFSNIRDILDVAPAQSSLLLQRKMVLEYQTALLLATDENFTAALKALRTASSFREQLLDTNIWEPGECETTKSQMLFLEGELLYVFGDTGIAVERFNAALEIDTRMNDTVGMEIIEKRLKLANLQQGGAGQRR